jgi:CRISPR-associated endoribonuclease Cas6
MAEIKHKFPQMRLYLTLTKNGQTIPFNYQPYLTGAIHKWLGKRNAEHDALSLYSFSWLQNVSVKKSGIVIKEDSYFFISSYDDEFAKRILKGIVQSPKVCFGSSVSDIEIIETPFFQREHTFFAASPVFIKRRIDNNEKHITYENPSSSLYLTETLEKKLQTANLSTEGVTVKFDDTFTNARTKIISYNEIGNRVTICPVIVKGSPEQIAFAWNVGVGNSTGIGFGALK